MPLDRPLPRARSRAQSIVLLLIALLLGLGGLYQIAGARAARSTPPTLPVPASIDSLTPGVAARMDSPFFAYSPGWTVGAEGADPAEPADPALTPSGVISFTYRGGELALQLGVGNYWGFLYVTVDGEAANLLPSSRGHAPPAPQDAGYRPLFAPEMAQTDGSPGVQWVAVHRAAQSDQIHEVRIEGWRSWGQTPIRAVSVDALPPPPPALWPGALLLVAAIWCAAPLWGGTARVAYRITQRLSLPGLARRLLDARGRRIAIPVAAAGLLSIVAAILLDLWPLCALGVILLGGAGIVRPALWYGALLFGLPFYYSVALPLLPTRALNLVDTGVFLGLGVALAHAVLVVWRETGQDVPPARTRLSPWPLLLLALIASWAFVSMAGAERTGVALREWRTVFLMAVALAAGLSLALHLSPTPRADSALLVGGWLTGASLMAALALALYPAPQVTIPAEGVTRLRGFYGSPNNLALYLGRTLAVTLAPALFARGRRLRLLCGVAALVQGAAFLLTFSRGGLLVALPAMLLTLWLGGYWLLRREGRSTRVLWLLLILAGGTAAALLPFAGTERLQQAITLAQGTGFLRANLWRSAWRMALDHPLLGVGPDNFLYVYRSQYILPQAWMEPNLNHPHTWLLDWWVRIGLPGMALGLLYWGVVVRGAVRGLHMGGWGVPALGLLAASVAALAHGLIDVSYALPDLMALWAFFGVLVSIERDQEGTGGIRGS